MTSDPQKYREWATKNREHLNLYHRRWRAKNAEHYNAYWAKRRKAPHRIKYHANYKAKRRKTDIQFKLAEILRHRIYLAMSGEIKNGSAIKLLGVTLPKAIRILEAKFQPGMSWGNYGRWHVDHKRPLSSFDLTDRKQLAQACNIKNLQPLWARDNIRKGCHVYYPSRCGP